MVRRWKVGVGGGKKRENKESRKKNILLFSLSRRRRVTNPFFWSFLPRPPSSLVPSPPPALEKVKALFLSGSWDFGPTRRGSRKARLPARKDKKKP